MVLSQFVLFSGFLYRIVQQKGLLTLLELFDVRFCVNTSSFCWMNGLYMNKLWHLMVKLILNSMLSSENLLRKFEQKTIMCLRFFWSSTRKYFLIISLESNYRSNVIIFCIIQTIPAIFRLAHICLNAVKLNCCRSFTKTISYMANIENITLSSSRIKMNLGHARAIIYRYFAL